MTTSASEGSHLLGSLRLAGGVGVVRVENRYDATIDDVWSALTDPSRLLGWYGRVEGDLRLGGEFRINVDSSGWDGTGRVDACEAPHRLLVTTRETDDSRQQDRDAKPYDEVIEAWLTADGHHMDLIIEVRGMPLELIAFYGAGWQVHAEDLAAYLAGSERKDVEARFDGLVAPYQQLAAGLS